MQFADEGTLASGCGNETEKDGFAHGVCEGVLLEQGVFLFGVVPEGRMRDAGVFHAVKYPIPDVDASAHLVQDEGHKLFLVGVVAPRRVRGTPKRVRKRDDVRVGHGKQTGARDMPVGPCKNKGGERKHVDMGIRGTAMQEMCYDGGVVMHGRVVKRGSTAGVDFVGD